MSGFISFKGVKIPLSDGTVNGGGSSVPVGTVMSFIATIAPAGYLVCDGSVQSINDYPDLAAFFADQFGESNHFGGDGTTTFAVPDMRNMFLRGYHGDGEQLSGEIGMKQEATKFPGVFSGTNVAGESLLWGTTASMPNGNLKDIHANNYNLDTHDSKSGYGYSAFGKISDKIPYIDSYTSRPVNVAVLFCIKAVKEMASGGGSGLTVEEYNTDDGWQVRKYSDGYIEMFIYRVTEIVRDRIVDVNDGVSYFSNCFPQTAYPVPLTEKYQEVASIVPSNDIRYLSGWANVRGIPDQNSLLHTAEYSMCRPAPFNLNLYPDDIWYIGVRVSVTGRWK